jgi:ABC-type phosphate transport system permease subunit
MKLIVREYDNMLIGSVIFIFLNAIFGAFIGIAGAIFVLFNRNYALSNAEYLED